MTHKPLGTNDLDVMIVRELSRLPSFAPSRSLGDRVMARVQLPQPTAVVVYRRAAAWVRQPRHVYALAATYAVVALAALVVTVPWLLANMPEARLVADWFVRQASAAGGRTTLLLADLAVAVGAPGFVKLVPRSAPVFWAGLFGLASAYAACIASLRLLLRAPRGAHAPARLVA